MRRISGRSALGALLTLTVLAGVAALGGVLARPSPVAPSGPTPHLAPTVSVTGAASSPIDTKAWPTVRVRTLGYSIQLPPTFELVGEDTAKPVPSIDSIANVAPLIADGLRSQSERLAASAGVFGELGLWGIEPDSLSQIGLLAGRPYRIDAADLESVVQAAVTARATPLEGGSVDPIELPLGVGYLASYRDAVDLGAHREVHLRTPAGRYLVLVMTFITPTIDAASERRFLAMAGSLGALDGAASGDAPAPSVGPAEHADAALEAMLPNAVGGVSLQKRSLNGEELVGGNLGSGTVLDAIGSLVSVPGKVTVALGVPDSGAADLVLSAFRLEDVDPSAVDVRLAQFPAEVWSRQSVGGRDVLESVAGSDGRRTYLRRSGDVLEEVVSSDVGLATEAVAGLQ